MSTLYLIRHGETFANKYKRVSGHYNTRLIELGIQQARQIGERLKSKNIEKIYASPLIRAKSTAKYIGGVCEQLNIIIDQRIIEKNMGIFNGRTWKSVKKEYTILDAQDPFSILEKHISVEKDQEIVERCMDFLDEIFRRETGNIVCVSHAGTINVMRSICESRGSEVIAVSYRSIKNCSGYMITIENNKPIEITDIEI